MQFTVELNNKIRDLSDYYDKELSGKVEEINSKIINVSNFMSKVELRLKKEHQELEDKLNEIIGV